MTDQTAKKVFDLLLSEIRSNGFTDIGTFMIDEVQKEFEYEQFDEKYEYSDTEKIISNYETLSSRPQGGQIALQKLLDASIEYFSLAYNIPDGFLKQLNELSNERGSGKIILNTINEEDENIDTLLKSKSVNELVTLLIKVRGDLEKDDEAFLNSI